MTRYLALMAVALGCLLAVPGAVLADVLSVEEWFLGVTARDDDYEHAWFDVPQSPFVDEHSVTLPSSPQTTSAAQYLIEYFSNYGSFHIASQQQAEGLASGSVYTTADGQILVSVSEPMPLHIDASWSYELPASFMMTQFSVDVRDSDNSQNVLFHQTYTQTTFPGDPWSGTLPIQGDVIIPPGVTWRISYWTLLEADAGPGNLASGAGYVDLTITPESSTLTMLAPLLLTIPRCTGHRRRG